MCDGSVHTIGNNINPWTWGLLCCPDDDMPIPGDWEG
jgi:hypothetical protein